MLFVVFGGLIVGVLLGRLVVSERPLIRRGIPGLIFILGLFSFRRGLGELGIDAVEAGALNGAGRIGIFLMLVGLTALLAIVLVFTGSEVARSSRIQKRKNRR